MVTVVVGVYTSWILLLTSSSTILLREQESRWFLLTTVPASVSQGPRPLQLCALFLLLCILLSSKHGLGAILMSTTLVSKLDPRLLPNGFTVSYGTTNTTRLS
jgi:hypothetical protein